MNNTLLSLIATHAPQLNYRVNRYHHQQFLNNPPLEYTRALHAIRARKRRTEIFKKDIQETGALNLGWCNVCNDSMIHCPKNTKSYDYTLSELIDKENIYYTLLYQYKDDIKHLSRLESKNISACVKLFYWKARRKFLIRHNLLPKKE